MADEDRILDTRQNFNTLNDYISKLHIKPRKITHIHNKNVTGMNSMCYRSVQYINANVWSVESL